MKDFIQAVTRGLLWVWQLPQNILGVILTIIYGFAKTTLEVEKNGRVVLYSSSMKGGISIGRYIVLAYYYRNLAQGSAILKHEFGHTYQSMILGPLYLLVIGLPSIVWAWMHSSFKRFEEVDYYSFYTEKWANRLADKYYTTT